MARLIDRYDAALFDLDGVIYLGPHGIPGVAEAIAALRASGVVVGFVTNNAARPPQVVADHLTRLDIPCGPNDVVTSAQAMAHVMADQLPAGSTVLVVGTQALAEEVRRVGLVPGAENPAGVVVGFDPDMRWSDLNRACYAVQGGATWYVCNNDYTRPTEHGTAIGLGAMADAMRWALPGIEPIMAGKPHPPLLLETLDRVGSTHPIFVGDRLDTDIEGANRIGIDSLLVLTGAHGKHDLVAADADQRPSALGLDVAALLDEPRVAVVAAGTSTCNGVTATASGGRIVLTGVAATRAAQVDALWAVARLAWSVRDGGGETDASEALDGLDLLA